MFYVVCVPGEGSCELCVPREESWEKKACVLCTWRAGSCVDWSRVCSLRRAALSVSSGMQMRSNPSLLEKNVNNWFVETPW